MKTPQQLPVHAIDPLHYCVKGSYGQVHAPQCSAQVHAPPIPFDPLTPPLVNCLSRPLETIMMVLANVEAQQCIQAGLHGPTFPELWPEPLSGHWAQRLCGRRRLS